jgi:hypothetical protein
MLFFLLPTVRRPPRLMEKLAGVRDSVVAAGFVPIHAMYCESPCIRSLESCKCPRYVKPKIF